VRIGLITGVKCKCIIYAVPRERELCLAIHAEGAPGQLRKSGHHCSKKLA
jgi:hypothetical protein